MWLKVCNRVPFFRFQSLGVTRQWYWQVFSMLVKYEDIQLPSQRLIYMFQVC